MLERLVTRRNGKPRLELISLGLNYPYRQLPSHEAETRLSGTFRSRDNHTIRPACRIEPETEESRRRHSHLRAVQGSMDGSAGFGRRAALGPRSVRWPGNWDILDRVIEVPHATSELLEALYNCATALLFPSTFEGFGWPIAEAHACGCPVICTDREPMTDVAGNAGLAHDVEDEAGFAEDLLRLTNPAGTRTLECKGA